MKNLIYLIFVVSLLVACSDDNRNMAPECKEVFDTISAIQLKMQTSSYVPKSMALEYKRQNDEFISNFKKGLKKANYDKQVLSCKPTAKVLKNQLEQLNNAKSEADVKQIFYGL